MNLVSIESTRVLLYRRWYGYYLFQLMTSDWAGEHGIIRWTGTDRWEGTCQTHVENTMSIGAYLKYTISLMVHYISSIIIITIGTDIINIIIITYIDHNTTNYFHVFNIDITVYLFFRFYDYTLILFTHKVMWFVIVAIDIMHNTIIIITWSSWSWWSSSLLLHKCWLMATVQLWLHFQFLNFSHCALKYHAVYCMWNFYIVWWVISCAFQWVHFKLCKKTHQICNMSSLHRFLYYHINHNLYY